jgi:hypothetical protein
MNCKVCGKIGSWSNLKYYPGGTDENHGEHKVMIIGVPISIRFQHSRIQVRNLAGYQPTSWAVGWATAVLR